MNQEQRRKAAALRYNEKQQTAPKVAATGKGLIAESIIEKAQENDVPILEDASLAELLSELNINESIPAELYEAVAEVFAFIYEADQKID